MKRSAAVCLAILALIGGGGLAACNPSGETGPRSGANSNTSDANADKLAAYTSAFNDLVGGTARSFSGLPGRAEAYLGYDIATASPSDTIELDMNPPWLSATLDNLKKARGMRSDTVMAPVDRDADVMIRHLETIIRIESGLGGYYETRVYRQDGLAKGRAADLELSQAYQGAIQTLEQMSDDLAVVERGVRNARVEHLRARGYAAEASLMKAMGDAELMTSAIIDNDMPVAGRAADDLQQSLEEMRANKRRLKNKADEDSYDLVLDSLTTCLAKFRDHQAGDRYAGSLVVGPYNNAVRFSGNMTMPS